MRTIVRGRAALLLAAGVLLSPSPALAENGPPRAPSAVAPLPGEDAIGASEASEADWLRVAFWNTPEFAGRVTDSWMQAERRFDCVSDSFSPRELRAIRTLVERGVDVRVVFSITEAEPTAGERATISRLRTTGADVFLHDGAESGPRFAIADAATITVPTPSIDGLAPLGVVAVFAEKKAAKTFEREFESLAAESSEITASALEPRPGRAAEPLPGRASDAAREDSRAPPADPWEAAETPEHQIQALRAVESIEDLKGALADLPTLGSGEWRATRVDLFVYLGGELEGFEDRGAPEIVSALEETADLLGDGIAKVTAFFDPSLPEDLVRSVLEDAAGLEGEALVLHRSSRPVASSLTLFPTGRGELTLGITVIGSGGVTAVFWGVPAFPHLD